MCYLYLIALVPIIIGGILWYFDKKVTWSEWLIGSASALALALIFNLIALGIIHSRTSDIQTISGQITHARHYSAWREYYEEAIYRTEYYTVTVTNPNGKGSHTERRSRQVFDHWEPRTRWHNEYWQCFSDINTTYDISEDKFNYFVNKYKKLDSVPGIRHTFNHNSHMIEGDPNDYVTDKSKTQWIEPCTKTAYFENKIKATPNLFQFVKVPTNIQVYPWPENPNWNRSDRLIGTASILIDNLKFDQMNSILGPLKKVNVIIIGFGNKDESYAEYQQAKYIGGKKNDLVVCFGGGSRLKGADWVKVFGWTESELVKRNLETIFLTNPINDDILPIITKEIKLNYKIKDWHKFDYIVVRPPDWIYPLFLVILFLIQSGLYIYFHLNDNSKVGDGL